MSDTWVMYPHIGRNLVDFHHRVDQRLTGWKLQRVLDGMWMYPLMTEAMSEVVLQEVETYVSRHHNTVVQYILTRPFMTCSRPDTPFALILWYVAKTIYLL